MSRTMIFVSDKSGGNWLSTGRTSISVMDLAKNTNYIKHTIKIKESGKRIKCFKEPGLKTLKSWCHTGIARTPCGCKVEPDGHCHHGFKSWLIYCRIV